MKLQLAIDRGNSRTKVSVGKNEELLSFQSFSDDDLTQGINDLFHSYDIAEAIISNVREDQIPAFLTACIPVKITQLSYRLNFPFAMRYNTPETVGNDRLANMAGATVCFPNQNILVIDCGTCITASILSEGAFCGGSISPGLRMRFDALEYFTGKLPKVNPSTTTPSFPGDTTESSILIGVQMGLVNEIDSLIAECSPHYHNLKVVLTGGDYSFFENSLKSATFASPQLTQFGLHEILRINH